MLLLNKKIVEISKIAFVFKCNKKYHAHPFYIENKLHNALGFSHFDAKQKINFMWPKSESIYNVVFIFFAHKFLLILINIHKNIAKN